MTSAFPAAQKNENWELTLGTRVVNGVTHRVEFWNHREGMRIYQVNPQRPWVTLLAEMPCNKQEETERFNERRTA